MQPTSKTVFDVVKPHLKLPIHQSYAALKQALRDWHHYATAVPLQNKPRFPAEIHVIITRPRSPIAAGSVCNTANRTKWWKRSSVDSTEAAPPHIYRKIIPLSVWTAVLPWEMQRGLSFSKLMSPSALKGKSLAAAPTDTAVSDADPYGVVSTVSASSTPHHLLPPCRSGKVVTTTVSPTRSVDEVLPAMLFLCDTKSTRENGIGFWSGAIVDPIDVLFISPTLPASIAASPSFRQLQQQDQVMLAEDPHSSSPSLETMRLFFPQNEMQSASTTFRLHSFDHLDPLPPPPHPRRRLLDAEDADDQRYTVVPQHPYDRVGANAPRYVMETVRHTIQPAVQSALRESAAALRAEQAGGTPPGEAEIDIQLHFSAALREDIAAKAQLHVEYVTGLERAVAHFAAQINVEVERKSGNAAAEPDAVGDDEVGVGCNAGEDPNKRIKVWFSEHESHWMTEAELQKWQSSHSQEADTTKAAKVFDEEVDAAYLREPKGEDMGKNKSDAVASVTVPVTRQMTSENVPQTSTIRFQPIQPDAVSPHRSIAAQSPILAEEDEARPSYLAPSFIGRHDAAAFQRHGDAVVVSAKKLMRYPETHSHMPALPPIDYELLDLSLRLGIGQQTVLYHYYERMLRELHKELKRRQNRAIQNESPSLPHQASVDEPVIPEEAMKLLVALVRDASLQIPSEMTDLVEAVAARPSYS